MQQRSLRISHDCALTVVRTPNPKPSALSVAGDRELATTDVGYVKWTQWIFLQLFKKGLAFQSEVRTRMHMHMHMHMHAQHAHGHGH